MGAKCSEMAMGTPSKVDAQQAFEEEDQEDGEEEAEEEDEEEDEENSAKADAQAALQGGLVRGKTAAFKEAIDFAQSVGIDETMISKAEAKLQEHKVVRERESFIEELPKFLKSEDAEDEAACEEKLKVAKSRGVPEQHVQKLRDQIEFIKLGRDLEDEEVQKANELTVESTRRFVSSCFGGRSVTHVASSGKRIQALCHLDPALREIKMVEAQNNSHVCCIPLLRAQACAATLAELGEDSGVAALSEDEQDRSIALSSADGDGPYLLVESRVDLATEFLLALAVLGGKREEKITSTTSIRSNRSRSTPSGAIEKSPSLPDLEDLEEEDKKERKEKKDKKEKKEDDGEKQEKKEKKEKKEKDEDEKKEKKDKKEKKSKK